MKAKREIFKPHNSLERRQHDLRLIDFIRFLRRVDHIRKPFKTDSQLLNVLPNRGETKQRLGDVTRDDPERNQLTECQIAAEHHGCSNPEHHQLRDLLQHLAGLVESSPSNRFRKSASNVFGVETLPAPAAHHFHVLSLNRLDTCEHLDEMTLGLGVLLSCSTELAAKERSSHNCQNNLDWKNAKGN